MTMTSIKSLHLMYSAALTLKLEENSVSNFYFLGTASEMTYIVSSGALNSTHSLRHRSH